MSKQLTDDFALLTGCIRVTAPKYDQRMVIECASKSARRQLYTALRKKRGPLKCSLSLSAIEYTNKAEVYRQARRWRLNIEDKGDMMIVKNSQATGQMTECKIWLDRPTTQIEHAILKVRGSRPPSPPRTPHYTRHHRPQPNRHQHQPHTNHHTPAH
jgi:hypothetical protein